MIKIRFVFLLLTAFISINIIAQCDTCQITAKKVFGGYKFESEGKKLSLDHMLVMMQNEPEAYRYISKAKTSATFANILGFVGGFCIGWTAGTLIGGGDVNLPTLGIGAGCIIATIPIVNSANKNSLIAIDKYNNRNVTGKIDFDLRLGFTQNGVGFSIQF